MTYPAVDVGRFLVRGFIESKRPASHMKIQKLLYFAWVDYYRTYGEELFGDW